MIREGDGVTMGWSESDGKEGLVGMIVGLEEAWWMRE